MQDKVFERDHAPVIANVDADSYCAGTEWPDLLVRQLTSPVEWERSVFRLRDDYSCTRLIEVGSGKTLAGLIRRIDKTLDVRPVEL